MATIRSNRSPPHRVEAAALAELDRLDAVQRRVEGGEAERAGVDVRRHHALRVLCGEERLDAAPGAEIERRFAGAANGELGQRDGRCLDPGDVIERNVAAAFGPGVRGDDVVAVRHEPDEPQRQAVPDLEQAEAREPVDREPGRLLDAAGRQCVAEQEDPCERVERVVAVEPAPMDVGVDRSRGQLAGAEPLLDALGGVAGELECSPELAQATGVAAVGNRASHPAIVARTSPVGPVGRARL